MNVDNSTIRVRVGAESHDDALFPEAEHPSVPELQNAFTPPIDIHEGPEGLTLEADLPGATERNLRIQLEDNVLSLYAKIDSPVPEGARLVHEEYRLGDLSSLVHPQRRGRSRANHGRTEKWGPSALSAQGRAGSDPSHRDQILSSIADSRDQTAGCGGPAEIQRLGWD